MVDQQRAELEGPGEYVVLSKAVVSRDLVFGGQQDAVAKVQVGTRVRVEEVRVCDEDKRIRGRLRKPAGWISLVNMETGRRWAARMVLCPERHALKRVCTGRRCACSLCERIYQKGSIFLTCKECEHHVCMRCLKSRAPLQGWTYQVIAGAQADVLGFQYDALPKRVMVRSVEPGTWAERVGMQPLDELTAINGIGVDQVTPEELESMLAQTRPLEFTFVYSGPDAPPAGSKISTPRKSAAETESVPLSIVVQNVDFTRLSADNQLFANFKSIMRHAVAQEAANRVLREDVELAFSGFPMLVVRCAVTRLSEAAALDVRQRLSSSATLGAQVTIALNRLPAIQSIAAGGPVSVVKVEVEPMKEHVQKTERASSGLVWQPFVATRTFLRRFKKQPSAVAIGFSAKQAL